jgi:hypothetical protein
MVMNDIGHLHNMDQEKNMSMRRRMSGTICAIALTAGLVAVAAPASAEVWTKAISCGINNRCFISSTTTISTSYTIDGVLKASWGSGGNHSWSGAVSAAGHTVGISSGGTISAHNAYCYCPPGQSCGI